MNDNEEKFDYNNPLEYQTYEKESKVNKLRTIIDYQNDRLNDTNREIKKMSSEISNNKINYKSCRLDYIGNKFKIYRLSSYSKKMAKINMSATLLLLTKQNEEINANNYLPKSERKEIYSYTTVNQNLVDKIKRLSTEEINKSIESIEELNITTLKLRSTINETKSTISEKKEQLRDLKSERNNYIVSLLKSLKEYFSANKEYKKLQKRLKK